MLAHHENLSRRPSFLLARTSAATLYIYVAYVSLSFSVFIIAASLYQTQSAGVAYTRDELVRQEVFLVFVILWWAPPAACVCGGPTYRFAAALPNREGNGNA